MTYKGGQSVTLTDLKQQAEEARRTEITQPSGTPGHIENHSIIYFGNDWYAENRTSSHHIAARLSKRVPLLYVSTPGMRPPTTSRRDLSRAARKLAEAVKLPRQIGETMWTITLPHIPFAGFPLVPQLNSLLGAALLSRAIRHLHFSNPISWFVVPHPGGFAKRLNEQLSVYYCIDEYAAFPGVNKQVIQGLDDHLTKVCDLVFFCTKRLMDLRHHLREDAIYSPHGVDADLFGTAMDPDLPVAAAARNLPRPVIGYFGNITAWVDVALIEEMARSRPGWTFLIVGLSMVDVSALRALPNVLMPGPQNYQNLPSWAKAFDVCIAPHTTDSLMLNANPLKIREYLATGRPVVSTWLPEIDLFSGAARLVRHREAFLPAIEEALREGIDTKQSLRLEAVRAMSWDARVQSIIASVEGALSSHEH